MPFFKKMGENLKESKSHHFVFIESPIAVVWSQVMSWGDTAWWPEKSVVTVTRVPSEPLAVGSRLVFTYPSFLNAQWEMEVVRIDPNAEVECVLTRGIFTGKALLSLEERYNGTKVTTEMSYEMTNPIRQIAWSLFYESRYDKAANDLLKALRDYCQTQQRL